MIRAASSRGNESDMLGRLFLQYDWVQSRSKVGSNQQFYSTNNIWSYCLDLDLASYVVVARST